VGYGHSIDVIGQMSVAPFHLLAPGHMLP
jgi:hypothetical protein